MARYGNAAWATTERRAPWTEGDAPCLAEFERICVLRASSVWLNGHCWVVLRLVGAGQSIEMWCEIPARYCEAPHGTFKNSWTWTGKCYHIFQILPTGHHRSIPSAFPPGDNRLGRWGLWTWHQELLWFETIRILCSCYSPSAGTLKENNSMWRRYYCLLKFFTCEINKIYWINPINWKRRQLCINPIKLVGTPVSAPWHYSTTYKNTVYMKWKVYLLNFSETEHFKNQIDFLKIQIWNYHNCLLYICIYFTLFYHLDIRYDTLIFSFTTDTFLKQHQILFRKRVMRRCPWRTPSE